MHEHDELKSRSTLTTEFWLNIMNIDTGVKSEESVILDPRIFRNRFSELGIWNKVAVLLILVIVHVPKFFKSRGNIL